jgi:hypothetical protein
MYPPILLNRYGGSVKMAMNGRPQLEIEVRVMAAHIAVIIRMVKRT